MWPESPGGTKGEAPSRSDRTERPTVGMLARPGTEAEGTCLMKTRRTPILVLAFLFAVGSRAAGKGWGDDVNSGAGPALIENVRADLAALVKAPPADREARARDFVARRGEESIEAAKRFRNPELTALFHAYLATEDWKLKHRALHVLSEMGDVSVLPAAWELLAHPVARMREKAAITLIELWQAAAAKSVAGGKPAEALAERQRAEPDPHVRSALEALARRIAGKLEPIRVHTEVVRTLDDGLMLTPFLDGFHNLGTAAPGVSLKANLVQGGAGQEGQPAATRWVTPVLGFGTEEVKGVSLQPFANLRQNGTVYHTGLDVAGCIDGCGYYAIADGVVRMVHSNGDMGTLTVIEHPAGRKTSVVALYMHGGGRMYVKPGDKVVCGQLIGTMGLSYSIENGGHFAHLHFGLYPGPFSPTHNYGYRAVSAGLEDWFDPVTWLPERIEATRPLVDDPPFDPALKTATAALAREEYAKAWAEAKKAGDAGAALVEALEQAPAKALARAEKRHRAGWPREALEFLEKCGKSMKGVPGAEGIDGLAKTWGKDPTFQKALAGEKEIVAAEAKAAELAAKKSPPEAIQAIWQKLLDKYGDTVLADRIRVKLPRSK